MPKPTQDQLYGVYNAWCASNPPASTAALADALNHHWSMRWEEEEAERERGRMALRIVDMYGGHMKWCGSPSRPCDCGFVDAVAALREGATEEESIPPPAAGGGSYGYEAGCFVTNERGTPLDDLEQHNAEQRIRRDTWEVAALYYTNRDTGESMGSWRYRIRERAAATFPLRKRVPKPPIPDPHDDGHWQLAGTLMWLPSSASVWRSGSGVTALLTIERVSALAALLAEPFELVDDHSVEDA